MFVKKKKKLTSISSEYTNIPIQRTTLGVRVPIEREKKKSVFCIRKTLRFICVRLTHNCRQVIIIFFLPLKGPIITHTRVSSLSSPVRRWRTHIYYKHCREDALQHTRIHTHTHPHTPASRQTVKSVDIIIHLNCGAGVGFLGNAHSCPKFRYRLFFFFLSLLFSFEN